MPGATPPRVFVDVGIFVYLSGTPLPRVSELLWYGEGQGLLGQVDRSCFLGAGLPVPPKASNSLAL